jgi:NAD(P)-dependent dehydrogenase (short-subunit alcohol dehydrogenase family)
MQASTTAIYELRSQPTMSVWPIDNAAMDRQCSINTLGVIANIRAASKVLPDGARIISVGSGLGTRVALPGTADYAASKAAVVGYSRGAVRDLGRRNITVNVVQAGLMDIDMSSVARETGFLHS